MERRFDCSRLVAAVAAVLAAAGWFAAAASAQEQEGEDRTLSPFFFIPGGDEGTDRLPLKSTRADVKVAGVIADVTVTQVYKNEGKKTIEAIYIFPGSTRAAVYAMKMTIGERVIEAEIKERKKAREEYEQAKQEGKTASLLEQQRPNVFQMNVANILPGDEIKVEMKYTEVIEPEENVYEFVFPTVVGPRYSNTPAAGAADTQKWVENPYLHEGEAQTYNFGLDVDIKTGIDIAQLSSPSHDVDIEYTGKSAAHLKVKDGRSGGNKDFVLRYKLAGDKIEAGLLLYKGKEENFFLMMMEPPARVQAGDVMPREYVFIVDVSGSMYGFPLDISKALMKEAIGALRPIDFFNVLMFSGGSAVLSASESLPATEANKQKAIGWIMAQQGGGGTEILPAFKKALALPRQGNASRIVVVATDGYVSVEPEVFELIRKSLGQANLFAFGIGASVNRYLIEGMARVGMGEPFVVLKPADAQKQAERLRHYIESPVLTRVKVEMDGFKTREVEPLSVPDMFAQRPIVLFGKWNGDQSGKIVVSGKTADGDFKQVMDLGGAVLSDDNAALRLLWARHRIMRLADLNKLVETDERVKEVTNIGLKYSLMTQYTSFVAIDKVKRADGKFETVKQPLPLPEGVSDYAVGEAGAAASGNAYGYGALGVMGGSGGGGGYAVGFGGLGARGTGKGGGGYASQGVAKRKVMMRAPMVLGSAPKAEGRLESVDGLSAGEETESDEKAVRSDKPSATVAQKRVEIVVASVSGGLSKAAVEKAVKTSAASLKFCFPTSMSKAQITVSFKIDSDGNVHDVKVESPATLDPAARSCIEKRLKQLKFGKPKSGAVSVTVKLELK